jgi:hypothetical protein
VVEPFGAAARRPFDLIEQSLIAHRLVERICPSRLEFRYSFTECGDDLASSARLLPAHAASALRGTQHEIVMNN